MESQGSCQHWWRRLPLPLLLVLLRRGTLPQPPVQVQVLAQVLVRVARGERLCV
jgi:hypothetical protein